MCNTCYDVRVIDRHIHLPGDRCHNCDDMPCPTCREEEFLGYCRRLEKTVRVTLIRKLVDERTLVNYH